MHTIIHKFDAFLNRFTMYKIVLYGLITFLVVAELFALTNVIALSAGGLALSILLLGLVCYGSNWLFARLFHAPWNSESYLITALILACALPPINSLHRALLVAATGVIAMASKYILVYRGSHVFNPAALAAIVMSVTGLLPAIWWIATPILAPFTTLLALFVLRKQRKFAVFFTFAVTAGVLLLYIGSGLHHLAVNEVVKGAIGSWPIIFVGSIMLTEPSTLPPTTYYQLLVAALVGIIFTSELHVGNLSASPQAALIAGNIFTLLAVPTFGAVLQLKKITKLSLNVYDLAFEKPSRNFKFTPGQYIEWTLQHAGTDIRGNRRTFSIASAPSEPEVHIGIKQYEPGSTFKKALTGLKAGKYIRVAHVAGNFTLPADAKQPLLFIAGGIGITPFRSMVTHLTAIGQKRDVILLYIAATDQDFVYRSDMDAATVVGVRTLYETGRLTKEQIAQLVPDVAKRTVYLSGPDAMVTGYKNMVRSLGVRRTKTDHFTGY